MVHFLFIRTSKFPLRKEIGKATSKINTMFLIFNEYVPQRSYKEGSYKKKKHFTFAILYYTVAILLQYYCVPSIEELSASTDYF